MISAFWLGFACGCVAGPLFVIGALATWLVFTFYDYGLPVARIPHASSRH